MGSVSACRSCFEMEVERKRGRWHGQYGSKTMKGGEVIDFSYEHWHVKKNLEMIRAERDVRLW